MTDEEKTKNEVEDMSTTTFSIAGVPIKVFKRFIRFCEGNAKMTKIFVDKRGNKQIKKELCYSIGLAQLLDRAESDVKTQMLYDRIVKLEDKVFTKDGTTRT